MFAGLFVIVAGAQRELLSLEIIADIAGFICPSSARAQRPDGRVVEPSQQRACCVDAEAVCRGAQ